MRSIGASCVMFVSLVVAGCFVEGSLGEHDSGVGNVGLLGDSGATPADEPDLENAGAEPAHDVAPEGGSPATETADPNHVDTTPSAEHAADAGPVDVVCGSLADDTACTACRKIACCDSLVQCSDHMSCICVWDCAKDGTSIEECETHCGASSEGLVALIHECEVLHCEAECG